MIDPCCGSEGLLLKFAKILGKDNVKDGFYGQEINLTTYNLCRINMFLRDINYNKFNIARGDTLENPKHWDDEPFDAIVSNPPYSIPWSGKNNPIMINDDRFSPAGIIVPNNKADLENIRKEKIAKEIKKYELLLKESLNDYKNGLLSEEDFDTFNDDYLFNLNILRIEQEEICNNDKLDLEWFNKFKKYKKVESITRDILDSLIEKILIYEDGNIKIIFNFQNEYDELIRYLNSHDFVV